MSNIISVPPRSISIPHERRNPAPAVVEALKSSMSEIGLLNPITIQSNRAAMRRYLVAGRNRLEAAIQLKWDTIDCIELPDIDEVEDAETVGKLAEIAENLHRREIDAVERGELIAAWDRLRSDRREVSAQLGQKPQGGRPSGGVSKAARDLGMTRQAVDRALKVAALSPEAKAKARSAGLANNQTALLKAAKHKEPAAQVAALDQHAAKHEPRPTEKPDPLHHIKSAWRVLTKRERDAFIKWLREAGDL